MRGSKVTIDGRRNSLRTVPGAMSLRVLPSPFKSTAPTRAVYGWPGLRGEDQAERPVPHERPHEALQLVEAVRVVDAAQHQAMALVVVAGGPIGVEVRRVRRVLHIVAGVAGDDRRCVGHRVFDLAERVGGAVLEMIRQAPVQLER